MSSFRWPWPLTNRLSRRHSRNQGLHRRDSSCRLRGEVLESRLPLSAAAPVWNDTSQLTLSFVPDGTDVGGEPSRLYATFDRIAPPQEWKEAILRALQTWVVHTRVNIGVVTDEGLPLGTPGPRTQDSRFGDLRIAARPLSAEVMAIGVAQTAIVGGTWSGDVIFNSAASYSSLDDLFAVALHEAGHVLGLKHSDDPLSPMYSHGLPASTHLTADDVRTVQDVQGQRQPDAYEGDGGNETLATAVDLPFPRQTSGQLQLPILVYGDLTTATDVDCFALPANHRGAGPVTVRVQSKGISLLAPRLRVVTRQGTEVASSVSVQPGGATLLVQIDELEPGERYFVQVAASRTDEFSVGAYTLIVTYEGLPQVDRNRINDVAVGRVRELDQTQLQLLLSGEQPLYDLDAHEDDRVSGARQLAARPEFTGSLRFESVASISDPSDIDCYRFDTLAVEPTDPLILNLSVHSLSPGQLIPRATVLDAQGQPLVADVLVNGQGEFVIQVQLRADQVYFVRIDAAAPDTPFAIGNYALTMSLVDQWVLLDTYLSAVVDSARPLAAQVLYVAQPRLFHLAVEALPGAPADRAIVVAQLTDTQTGVVTPLAAAPGETRTFPSLLLMPGKYTIVLFPAAWDGSDPAEMSVRLRGTSFSDPFSVDPIDPTENPVFTCPGNDGVYCYPGGIISEDPYLWEDFLDTLPELPNLDSTELIDLLLADWWSWYWSQQQHNGPVLTRDDEYAVDAADLNGDLVVDAADLEQLCDALRAGSSSDLYDLTHDGQTDLDDLVFLVRDLLGTSIGDATLDGLFNSADIVTVFQAGLYESSVPETADWSTGDWDCDGQFTSGDLVFAFQQGEYETDAKKASDVSSDAQVAAAISLGYDFDQYEERVDAFTLLDRPDITWRRGFRRALKT